MVGTAGTAGTVATATAVKPDCLMIGPAVRSVSPAASELQMRLFWRLGSVKCSWSGAPCQRVKTVLFLFPRWRLMRWRNATEHGPKESEVRLRVLVQ